MVLRGTPQFFRKQFVGKKSRDPRSACAKECQHNVRTNLLGDKPHAYPECGCEKTTDYVRIAERLGYLMKTIHWHLAVSVQKPKRIAQGGACPGVHLRCATVRGT